MTRTPCCDPRKRNRVNPCHPLASAPSEEQRMAEAGPETSSYTSRPDCGIGLKPRTWTRPSIRTNEPLGTSMGGEYTRIELPAKPPEIASPVRDLADNQGHYQTILRWIALPSLPNRQDARSDDRDASRWLPYLANRSLPYQNQCVASKDGSLPLAKNFPMDGEPLNIFDPRTRLRLWKTG